jgi:hypothetical protein
LVRNTVRPAAAESTLQSSKERANTQRADIFSLFLFERIGLWRLPRNAAGAVEKLGKDMSGAMMQGALSREHRRGGQRRGGNLAVEPMLAACPPPARDA